MSRDTKAVRAEVRAGHLSRKLCSSLRRSYSFGQRFSFLGESLAEKNLDSNPAVGSVVSDSTGLDFFLGCPFFPFVGRVPRFDRIISRQDRLGATILNSLDPQHPPLLRRISLFQSRSRVHESALHGSVLTFETHLELGIELVKAFFHPTGNLGPASIFEGGDGNSELEFDRVLGLKITAAVAADDF